MSVTDFAVFGAELLSCGFSGAFDQAAIGDEVLDCGEAVDIVDFVEENEAEDFAHSRDASKPIPAVDIVRFGLFDDVEFEGAEQLVVEVEKLEVDLDAFSH